MSVASCCCAPPAPLECTSCYGGNPCYPFQPANCPNESNRTYRIAGVTGGRAVSDYSRDISFHRQSFTCPINPCAALASACVGCTYSTFGGCNGTNTVTVDLCTGPMQRCGRMVSIYAGEETRGPPSPMWKQRMKPPTFQATSTPLVSCGGCGAPATYQQYLCDAPFSCTPPCSIPFGNPIALPCNLGLCSTVSCAEVDDGQEWLYETNSTATMEWTWSCADAGGPHMKQMTTVSGAGVSGFYQRGVATRANVSSCSNTTTTGWLGGINVNWDGFLSPLQTAVRPANDTFVTTLVDGICPRMDALVLSFSGAATWRDLSTLTTHTLSNTILGIYYGCPDLDTQNHPNPRYKNRTFRLDRWTMPTRMRPTIGGVGSDYLCSGAQCGNYSSLPDGYPNGSCWAANPRLNDIHDLLNGLPITYASMKEMYCVSDTVHPPVPQEDRYGCWWSSSGLSNLYIPSSVEVVRQGAW